LQPNAKPKAAKKLPKPPVVRQLSSGGKQLFNEATAPAEWMCPITQSLMHDPVIAADGTCYEREAIETWFAHHDTSPLTNLPVASKTLTPNVALRQAMQKEAETNDSLKGALEEETERFCRWCEQAYNPGEEWAHQNCETNRASKEDEEAEEMARLRALYEGEQLGMEEVATAMSQAPILSGAVLTAAGSVATVGSLVGGAVGGVTNFASGGAEVVGAMGDHVRRMRGTSVGPNLVPDTFGGREHQRSVIGGLTRATVGTVAAPLAGATTAAGCAVGTVAAAGFTLGAGANTIG
jgi:hypothetical protein